MKIAIAQINSTIGDFKNNIDKIKSFTEKAKHQKCDLVVFPELVITGYPPYDMFERQDFINTNIDCLNQLVDEIRGIGVVCGFADKNIGGKTEGNALFNSAVLYENGEILYKVNKRLLPAYDIFDERRHFEPGNEYNVFEYKGYKIGLTICEDIWNDRDIFKHRIYPIDPVKELINNGANFIINIAASPFHVGKYEFKMKMIKNVAQKYKIPLIYANQVGGNDSILFDGISMAFDPAGNIIARASDFKEDLIICDLNSFKGDIHNISKTIPESLLNALIMGTKDYLYKCGFSKAVLGLSGGIDSALTAAIAEKALGKENVLTIFMPSQYTSDDNFIDTKQLADNLGVEFIQVPIKPIFSQFLGISDEFDEKTAGVAEQNLQARIRGTILMAFSNKRGSLLLTTGNKSEMAVGYCTLYGDMNGGLAVISDVYKTLVYEISEFINKDKEIIPKRILEKAPSAELKPDQTDQDDLPPYDLLDRILKAYIEESKGLDELILDGFEKSLVQDIIKKVDRNEHKRKQAAPGLKVTPKAFGFGRRYPITQKYMPF